VAVEQREFVIGRGEDCDIVLPDRQVSRHHFRVVRGDDGYNVEDLGSKNGTYINGAPVRGSMRLQDGDEIQVALSVRLLFVGAEATLPDAGDAARRSAGAAPKQEPATGMGQRRDARSAAVTVAVSFA
jgi:pSer/pThr/pTyr-binding forkhead associated (FHA) protein